MRKEVYPKGSSQYINKLNKIRILNLIRENGKISRADLSRMSSISAPTVTRVVDSLIKDEGLVKEIGEGVSSGGRRPTLVEFAGLDNFVIGLDIGSTQIKGVLSNLNAKVIKEVKYPTQVNMGFDKTIDMISNVIGELCHHPQVTGKKIFGIGMAVAGLINHKKNIIEYSPDFHWYQKDILGALQHKCNLPVKFDNVTRLMALGELWYGVGDKIKNFIVVNIGYGIGAGIIINGQPLYGPKGMAGEFGHITLDIDSDVVCECGNLGCLEALASGRAIALYAQKKLENGGDSILKDMCSGNYQLVTAEMVAKATQQGDELSKKIFDRAAEYLGVGIAGVINLFSPEAVFLGGGVSQAGDMIFSKVRETIHKRAINTIAKDIPIKSVTFGMNAAVMGAIALILKEVLQLRMNSKKNAEFDLK